MKNVKQNKITKCFKYCKSPLWGVGGALLLLSVSATAQIRNVIVEKYYISDTLDATDTTNLTTNATYAMPRLDSGSITYRIYVQVDTGYKIKKIYGSPTHPLKLISTANYYNNIDRPSAYFGYLINKAWFNANPTLGLDSWLSLGLCTKTNTAVLKTDDSDGSVIGGSHNGGGTASIIGGILINNDTAAGIPIDTADGMIPKTGIYTTWSSDGFLDVDLTTDTTCLGSVNVDSAFVCTACYLQQNNGVKGDSLTGNKVIVAQLTTKGTLTFELNLELVDSTGATFNFVASDNGTPVTGDTTVLGLLKYPQDAPVCGCNDANYLEFNPTLSCYYDSLCVHRIVYGCTDTMACNYDPAANYNIVYLCCYPGNCQNRDIALVCPNISGDGGFHLFPNPVSTTLTLQFSAGSNNQTNYTVYDSFGVNVIEKDMGIRSGSVNEAVDVSGLTVGIYYVKLQIGNTISSKTFMKQ